MIEAATSGRAKCRGCEQPIAKSELRFGERHPNAFGDGEMTLWFHLACAACKRPEPLLEALATANDDVPAAQLIATATFAAAHRRLARINGAERATTGRARCRSCKDAISKGDWRIPLVFFEEFRFNPSGFVHARCAYAYFETTDIIEHVRRFSPGLDADALAEVEAAVRAGRSNEA